MDIINAETMHSLVDHDTEPCVSVFMPAQRAGRETRQGPIRLSNLLERARAGLVAIGLRRPDAESMLADAFALLDREEFWRYQEDGLALFVAPGRTDAFRVPESFEELVVVGEAFHVKPLWPLVGGEAPFYVLALSRNEVRLLWADRFRVGEVDLPGDMPASLAEAVWFDDAETQLQHRGASRVGRGRVVAAFHGHGVPEEHDEARVERFLRAVDEGVGNLIDPEAPLVLAGVEELTARFRRMSRHRVIPDAIVAGNPDEISGEALHERAVEIVEPLRREEYEREVARFFEADDLTVSSVAEAVPAALTGRVSSLFVPVGAHEWGEVDREHMHVVLREERAPGSRDLLDLAATATWSAGGKVHAVPPEDVPGDGPIAALLRY